MSIILRIRNCVKNCRYYLALEQQPTVICTYDDNEEICPGSACRYKLLTNNSARKVSSPEERLIRDTYAEGEFDMIFAEGRKRLAKMD